MTRDTLLFRRDEARRASRLTLQARVMAELRAALATLVPGSRVWVFDSLVQPGKFNDASDVDIALDVEPASMSIERLTSELAERLGRPADIVLLDHCRFRDKILREGELWTL